MAHVPDLTARGLDRISILGPSHTSQILGCTKGFGWSTAQKLGAALGCTPEWLLDGRGLAPTPDAVLAAVTTARAAHEVRKRAAEVAERKPRGAHQGAAAR